VPGRASNLKNFVPKPPVRKIKGRQLTEVYLEKWLVKRYAPAFTV